MSSQRVEKHSRTGKKLHVTAMSADEQTRRTQAAIARRAYEIFESGGFAACHEVEDWRQAESELVKPLCYGQMTVGDSLWVGTDGGIFEEGTIEIWVAARRLTICGQPRVNRQATALMQSRSRREAELIFRVADLPIEVDPSGVIARFNRQSLEILLKKAQAELGGEVRAAA
jgi:urocanate hydratase